MNLGVYAISEGFNPFLLLSILSYENNNERYDTRD